MSDEYIIEALPHIFVVEWFNHDQIDWVTFGTLKEAQDFASKLNCYHMIRRFEASK